MKLKTNQIDSFLKKPDAAIRAVLVYGPDAGLVRERGHTLSKLIVADLNDPFNAAHLTGEIIETDPSRLFDELNAQSLMGGDRLVRITSPVEAIASHLKEWLKSQPRGGVFVVIEAGDLGTQSSLRKLFEATDDAAALPCYVEDERGVGNFIRDELRSAGLTISADALDLMAQSIKGDRQKARMEVEKLIVYMISSPQKTVSVLDVQQSCGDSGVQSFDDLVYAVTGGNVALALRSYRRLLEDGKELMAIERVLQNHLSRLHLVRCQIDQGTPLETAMKSLQPPVFFKQADLFRVQVNRFSAGRLRQLLLRLAQIEAKTKQTGMPAETLVSDYIVKAASL
ncbi:MAG: DNA polymerase III subunit delta [Alphaproteobacteria bacterium]|nr:DNA polymerase III subunit delta [Alphaproteobacteria bacterium]